MSDDLRRRLEALGSVAVPPVTDARLDAIEARAMQATLAKTDRRRAAPLILAAAALVALLVAGVLFAAGAHDGGTLRLVAADGVTVEFVDDRTVAGVEGLVLDEGDIVDIGPDGSAIVGTDRFGPGRYQVVGGRLRSLDPVSSSSTVAPTVSRRSATTITTKTIAARDRQPDSTRPSTGPIARPSTTVDTTPPATSTRPDRSRTDRPETTVDRRQTTSTTTTPRSTTTGPAATDGRRADTTTSAPGEPTTTTTTTTPTTTTRPTTTSTTTVSDRTILVDERPTASTPTTPTTPTTNPQRRDRP